MMKCSACRATVPDSARFCPSCGHGLVTTIDERRIATVLFADLVGYTGLAEGRDPEQTKQLVDRCFERLAADIVSHGGRVDKVLGDAIVAVFGAPVAHEDDAERAVRAALQLRRSTADYAAEAGIPVELRIGINTGEVLIGAMRAGGDTTAMGDAVNVASRLQTAAQPGQILVGATTHAQTSGAVRYEPVGALSVRNRDGSVDAFAALEAVTAPGQRSRRSRTPFVGREQELAMLRAAFHLGLERERPQLVVITGEAGVGKSRLAEEVATTSCPEGTLVFDSRCVPYGEANVWWPLAEALRQAMAAGAERGIFDTGPDELSAEALRSTLERMIPAGAAVARASAPDAPAGPGSDHEGGLEADLDRIVAGLSYVLGDRDALDRVDAAQAREEALRSTIWVLDAITRRKPVVLGISELHWADDVVLELIDRAMDRLAGRPIVMLVSARPELLARWQPRGGRHGVVGLHLEPFDAAEAERLLDAMFEGAAGDELIASLVARSGGNPLFLEELALLVRESGHERDLPATLRGLVATRLDALDRANRRVLDDAAVVGRVGTAEALVALGSVDAATVTTALFDLAAQDMFDVDGRRWTFRSDIVREVAYETLAKAERARRHAVLSSWYAGHDDDVDLEHVAFHAASAAEIEIELGSVDGVPGDIRDRAVDAIERAAARALEQESSAEALRLYERGLALLPEGDGAVRRRFLAGRGRANTLLRRGDQAWADLEASLQASRTSGDSDAEAKALTALGQLAQTEGKLDEAGSYLDDALALWRRAGDVDGEARVLRLQATLHLMTGRVQAASEALGAARRHFEALGDRRGLAWAQQQLGWIAFTSGDLDTAEVLLSEAAETFSEMSDYAGLAWALGVQAWVRLQQGHLDEAERLAELSLGRGDTDTWATGMLTILLASTRLWTGRTEEAIELSGRALKRFAEMGDRTAQLRALGVLLRAYVAGGRAPEALETIDRYRTMTREEVDPGTRWLARTMAVHLLTAAGLSSKALEIAGDDASHGLGLALLLHGREQEAVDTLRAVWEAATGPGAVPDAGASYALALAATGRAAEAEAVIAEVRSIADGTYHDRTLLHIAEGVAAASAGDPARAAAVLDAALAIVDATGDQLAQAITRLARGHVLTGESAAIAGIDPAEELAEARSRLAAMGLRDSDWDALFARTGSFSAL